MKIKLFTFLLASGVIAISSQSFAQSATLNSSNGPTYTSPPQLTAEEKANSVNWNRENVYWRQEFMNRPYYQEGQNYDNYQPAYLYGMGLYKYMQGRPFAEINLEMLYLDWNKTPGSEKLQWASAQDAIRDAYVHIYNDMNSVNDSGASFASAENPASPASPADLSGIEPAAGEEDPNSLFAPKVDYPSTYSTFRMRQ